jgi:hypothetical protein
MWSSSKNLRALASSSGPSLPPDLRARTAWQGAAVSLALVFVGWPLELMMGRQVRGMPVWPPLFSMAVGMLLWIPLGLAHRRRPIGLSRWVFLVNNAAIAFAMWFTTVRWAAQGEWWMPFQAHKLSVLTAALIAPDVAVGLATIAIYAGSAVVQLTTFNPFVRAELALGEPWAMIAFAAFSVVLLLNRVRRQSMELALVHARGEAEALRRFARRLLAVRDLANTPLQTLEANAALVAEVPGAERYADRMRRSLDRLREWQHILESDASLIWSEQDLAFDPHEVLGEAP